MTFEVPALAAGFASKFDEIGPYIGFGSLVAVVAMAVLVFAQGRELQRLREWAGTSPERLDALEQELQAGTLNRLATPPRPGFVAPGGSVGAVPGATAAPGAGATPGAPPPPPGPPGSGPAAPAVPGAPGSPVVGAGAITPPGAVAGDGAPRPTPPRPTPPGATRVLPAAGPRAATAAGAAASTARERERDGDGSRRSIGQVVGVSAVGLVVLLALLFAFGVIGGSGDGPPAEGTSTNAGPTRTTPQDATPRYDRAEMTTVVLNASGTPKIARTVSDKIDQKLRLPLGEPTNYTVAGTATPQATTTVQYRTGATESVSQNRAAAQAIAKLLGLPTTTRVVRRMGPTVLQAAGDRKIVVIVGADYAAKNPPAGTPSPGSGSTVPGGTSTPSGAAGGGTATTTPGAATGGTSGGTPGAADGSTDGADPLANPTTDDLGNPTDSTGGTPLP